ncbi:YcxB-like protein [Devosia sp. YR412]|uniref:YcxB family protein n=1 Tax=Devosia sp. YR412 TaxID=1881030 RepID=UPI0008C8F9AD|nr:YcxB family protein [Devosia sp. YR412]SEQ28823.1 YcxB-like protein [Devosia sp. YR412]
MPDCASARFRLTEDDLVAAGQLYGWSGLTQRRTMIGLVLLWLIILPLVAWLTLGPAMGDPQALQNNAGFLLALSLAPFAATAAVMQVIMPVAARRTFRQQRSLQGELAYRWTSEHLTADTEYGAFDMPWSHFLRWSEDKRTILLFESDRLYRVIPKRVLPPDQYHSLRQHLAGIGR